jgi:hypothetical protein
MAASKIVEVPLHEISVDFYVRQALNEDHVKALTDLTKAGVEFPPIIVNDKYQIIDGRHRFNAYKEAGKISARCEVRRDMLPGDQILEALKCNMGGALPPSRADIRLAIQNMLAAGLKYSAILNGLPLPPSVSKVYLKEAASNMLKQRISLAVAAVTEMEMPVSAAAAKYNVSVDSLKLEISGKRRKAKDDIYGVPKMKGEVSKRATSTSHKNAHLFETMLDAFMDGELTYKNACDVLDHAEKAITSQLNNITGWRLRFDAAKRTMNSNSQY